MNNLPAAAPLNPQTPMPYNPAREALETCILPRVLNGEEFLDDGANLLKACYNTAVRERLITAITTNDFHPKVINHLEEFLTANEGLIGELKNQYQPPHKVQLSQDHQRLVNWALNYEAPIENDDVTTPRNTLTDLRTLLAGSKALTADMYMQLDALSRMPHNQALGINNPGLNIRIALAHNPQAPLTLLHKLLQPQEDLRVRQAAISNPSTPEAAIQTCLQQDKDSSVLLQAAKRTFAKRSAATEPTEGEIQLRNRNIEGLGKQLDAALINEHRPAARRRLF